MKEIDLSKCTEFPDGAGAGRLTDHPDIKTDGTLYRVRYDGRSYTGTFSYQWYGLNFNGIYDAGCQFDAPGTNSSGWEKVYELKRKRKP